MATFIGDGTERFAIDENGNKNFVSHFWSDELAEESLKSLHDCKNCTNCKTCIGCESCTDCIDCSNCKNCISLVFSSNCENATGEWLNWIKN